MEVAKSLVEKYRFHKTLFFVSLSVSFPDLKKEWENDALLLLFINFALHPVDGRLKEEGYEMFIRMLCADLTQGIDILGLAFLCDDDNRVSCFVQDEVGE